MSPPRSSSPTDEYSLLGILTKVAAEAPKATDAISEDSVADPSTGQLAPKTIQLSDPPTLLDLVGLGVRTVSFLSVRVYVASCTSL